jgi:predicted ATP-grasp superfamily ATP-dependent carboligase
MQLERSPPVLDRSTPVLILGGKENSLAIARNLGRHGIPVRVSGPPSCWGMHSRYCRESFAISPGQTASAYWYDLLLASEDRRLDGHILFACSDEAIEFMARHRSALVARYVLDGSSAQMQLALLDKRCTFELAAAVDVEAPNHWMIHSLADIKPLKGVARFPLLLKPVHSHKFARAFGQKLFIIEKSFAELANKVALALALDLEVMVVEMIPGPDDLLSSYYTFVGEDGRRLFEFTKRVIRRYPANRGNACYHITEWLPDTAKAGRELFEKIGLKGLGNVEFKRDPRDGKLKLIEVNARFTAAHELLVRAGAPIDLIVYCELTGQPAPLCEIYEVGKRLWYPLRDFLAFLELRAKGDLDLIGWIRSLTLRDCVSPLWSHRDPWPVAGAALANISRLFRGE